MLYINPESANVLAAKELHYKRMRCYVRRKINASDCGETSCVICNSGTRRITGVPPEISEYFSDDNNLRLILTEQPKQLLEANNNFWLSIFSNYDYDTWQQYYERDEEPEADDAVSAGIATVINADHVKTKEITKYLKRIFNYQWFSLKTQKFYTAFELTSLLGRDTCTYCNRAYTNTIIRQRDQCPVIRPTLDHWFPKYNHPLLSISFYNLIPSCPTCNSYVKGFGTPDIETMIHPYRDPTQTSDFEFAYFFENSLSKYQIFIRSTGLNQKAKATLDRMHVGTIYSEAHATELTDLLTIQKNYTGSYIDSIKNLLGDHLHTTEIYRIAFGTEHEEMYFYKRPLSKFKHDMLTQMGILQTEK